MSLTFTVFNPIFAPRVHNKVTFLSFKNNLYSSRLLAGHVCRSYFVNTLGQFFRLAIGCFYFKNIMYLKPHWDRIRSEKYILCRHNPIQIRLLVSRKLDLVSHLSYNKLKYSNPLSSSVCDVFLWEVKLCSWQLPSFHPPPRFCSHSALYEIPFVETFCYSQRDCS